jgi:hypothetical protein
LRLNPVQEKAAGFCYNGKAVAGEWPVNGEVIGGSHFGKDDSLEISPGWSNTRGRFQYLTAVAMLPPVRDLFG